MLPSLSNAHADSGRRISACFVGASSRRPPCHASGRLPPTHPGGASPVRGYSHACLHGQCPRRLRPSRTGAHYCGISRKGALPRLSTSATSTSTPAVSYRCTWIVNLPGGALPRLPSPTRPRRLRLLLPLNLVGVLSGSAFATPPLSTYFRGSSHLLRAHPGGTSPGRIPCHASLHRHALVAP